MKRRQKCRMDLASGLRYYELERFRKLLSLMRRGIDSGVSVSVSQCSRIALDFPEVQAALTWVCKIRGLNARIENGYFVFESSA